MTEELETQCEALDASVLTGDALRDVATRRAFWSYLKRWERAIADFDATFPATD